MGSSCADRRRCRWGFLALRRQKCFPVYINRSHFLSERRWVASGIVSGKWPMRVICNPVVLGANLIHMNMMRSNVATRLVILFAYACNLQSCCTWSKLNSHEHDEIECCHETGYFGL
jgi:hypothetical protein